MRPFEILLSLANLVTFFILMARLPSVVSWMRYLAPIVLLIAIAQIPSLKTLTIEKPST